jgi:hypothetical protein
VVASESTQNVLQTFTFDNHNTTLKNINNKANFKFVLAVSENYNMAAGQKNFYAAPSTILFNKDTKMWMIHFTTYNTAR